MLQEEVTKCTDPAALEDFYAADFLVRLIDWMKQLFVLHDLVKTQAQAAADTGGAPES